MGLSLDTKHNLTRVAWYSHSESTYQLQQVGSKFFYLEVDTKTIQKREWAYYNDYSTAVQNVKLCIYSLMSVAIDVVSADFLLLILVLKENIKYFCLMLNLWGTELAIEVWATTFGLFIELLPSCIIYISNILPFFTF